MVKAVIARPAAPVAAVAGDGVDACRLPVHAVQTCADDLSGELAVWTVVAPAEQQGDHVAVEMVAVDEVAVEMVAVEVLAVEVAVAVVLVAVVGLWAVHVWKNSMGDHFGGARSLELEKRLQKQRHQWQDSQHMQE